jgi:radical SAM protein with 4Fe4S-binding SPASM domain
MTEQPRAPEPTAFSATPGVYHWERLVGEWPTRLHLRIDPDGGGMLIANAAQAASLSPVGVQMARDLLEGRSDEAVIADIKAAFAGATAEQVTADLAAVHRLIDDLARPGDNYPISNLGGVSVWERQLAAPLRADVIQSDPDTMRTIFHALWDAAVPHVTIITRPGADLADLPIIIEAAGDIGMIAGLRSVASWLTEDIIEQTAVAGLDHLDLLYISSDPDRHNAIAGDHDHHNVLARFQQCHDLELCPLAQVPLIAGNADAADEIAFALADIRVTNLVFFALACPDDDNDAQAAGAIPARALPQVAMLIEETAEDTEGRYLWAPPVRFDNSRSLAQQVCAGPRTATDVAIHVAADGIVYPARGPAECAGNLLTDTWQQIWGNDCFVRYRENIKAPDRCPDCPDLEICAAYCPKDPAGWSDDTQQ